MNDCEIFYTGHGYYVPVTAFREDGPRLLYYVNVVKSLGYNYFLPITENVVHLDFKDDNLIVGDDEAVITRAKRIDNRIVLNVDNFGQHTFNQRRLDFVNPMVHTTIEHHISYYVNVINYQSVKSAGHYLPRSCDVKDCIMFTALNIYMNMKNLFTVCSSSYLPVYDTQGAAEHCDDTYAHVLEFTSVTSYPIPDTTIVEA